MPTFAANGHQNGWVDSGEPATWKLQLGCVGFIAIVVLIIWQLIVSGNANIRVIEGQINYGKSHAEHASHYNWEIDHTAPPGGTLANTFFLISADAPKGEQVLLATIANGRPDYPAWDLALRRHLQHIQVGYVDQEVPSHAGRSDPGSYLKFISAEDANGNKYVFDEKSHQIITVPK